MLTPCNKIDQPVSPPETPEPNTVPHPELAPPEIPVREPVEVPRKQK